MSRCWSMLNNHRGRDSRPAASHGHVPNPTGPDVNTPSGGGEVPESARSRTDRPGRSAGAREALRAIPNTKRPARTRQKKTTKTTGHRNGGERRRTQEAPAEEAAHRGLNSYQSFLGRTLIQRLYICEDSQTTASRSVTTGGCPPMLKLFMIGNQNQKSSKSGPLKFPSRSFEITPATKTDSQKSRRKFHSRLLIGERNSDATAPFP